MKVLLLAIAVLYSCFVWAADGRNCTHDDKTFRCVEYVKNYDGDTITVNIPNVPKIIGKGISVRVAGIDAPERKSHDKCEVEAGRTAQKLVQSILRSAKNIELRLHKNGRDKYFRILAEVWADGQSIGELLIKNKLAHPYDGGKKLKREWCREKERTIY